MEGSYSRGFTATIFLHFGNISVWLSQPRFAFLFGKLAANAATEEDATFNKMLAYQTEQGWA